ncbi:MAG: L-fuculose-phosphate aldolase [Eubacteriales bacterium]|jgi:L-fuculose-phosphate aldolase|nr:L-fuculose-phosphate aldolase [Eubacteriales bacterium]MDD3290418.1 L-fuculose-phosphate aldolase [Eubacteriales bacterium]MDD3864209.1 L-fuculose-phosphate aldolase [Eubacteriales bacterium]MDD4445633.1 L-fuculose-phosphate aldolase [Eubacteriales bacterium]
MLLKSLREELIECGLSAIREGLTTGTGGNFSACDRESGLMAITPSAIPYSQIKPKDVVLLDIRSGEIKDSEAVPSSECDMHRIFYKYRTDLNAIIHTHTPFAATLSCFRKPLPAIHYLVAFGGLEVPCAEYATYGTVALAKNAFDAMQGNKAVLLANHGLLAGGTDLNDAFAVTEEIELCCQIYCRAMSMTSLGNPVILPREEMVHMIERFKNYGRRIEEHDEI